MSPKILRWNIQESHISFIFSLEHLNNGQLRCLGVENYH